MAYFNLLASAPESDVERLCRDPSTLLQPSLVLGASHLLASWVQAQPPRRLVCHKATHAMKPANSSTVNP